MKKLCLSLLLSFCFFISNAQVNGSVPSNKKVRDSIKKSLLLESLGTGYIRTKYFNFDSRYLIKYNQYEGFRTGLGGITTEKFSSKFRIQGYAAYGFLDDEYKYSIGGGLKIAKTTNSWINFNYTKDLQETGSSNFLTDSRFFQLFEPRLLNIDLFHKHETKNISIEHPISAQILSETEFSVSKIEPTYGYAFTPNQLDFYNRFNVSIFKVALQWSPFSKFKKTPNKIIEEKEGYPKFTLQYSKSFEDLFKSDFNFTKLDFRVVQKFTYSNKTSTEFVLTSGIASGEVPLTHLYHAYPNNVNKETVIQRFSVAGVNSFETMYFNEFFSDRFATLQIKHKLNRFNITPWFRPQLVLISRHALGDMKNLEKHQHISFGTLNKGYNESGFEINKLFLGFGLSFAYRYGAYHLTEFEDNFAFKFTFNIDLN